MHGVFRTFIFYVVPSTFYAFFGPQVNPADTCLEKVFRGHCCQLYHGSRLLNFSVYIWKQHALRRRMPRNNV
jgi:hypothetical protein